MVFSAELGRAILDAPGLLSSERSYCVYVEVGDERLFVFRCMGDEHVLWSAVFPGHTTVSLGAARAGPGIVGHCHTYEIVAKVPETNTVI